MNMTVNMNGLRHKLISAYNTVVRNLKEAIEDTCTDFDIERIHRDVDEPFDDLRCSIACLCCTYSEGNDSFSDMSEEADGLIDFMEEKEEG